MIFNRDMSGGRNRFRRRLHLTPFGLDRPVKLQTVGKGDFESHSTVRQKVRTYDVTPIACRWRSILA